MVSGHRHRPDWRRCLRRSLARTDLARALCGDWLCFGTHFQHQNELLLVKNIEVSGLQVSDYRKRAPELMAHCMQEIFAMFEAGKLRPAPTVTYPLDAFAQALQEIVERRATGRIVLEPNP